MFVEYIRSPYLLAGVQTHEKCGHTPADIKAGNEKREAQKWTSLKEC